jgi:hypothetical protein
MYVTGEIIDGPDSSEDRRDGYRTHVSTPEEAHRVARDLLRRGVDGLKVYQNLTPDLLQAIVEEAHNAGTEAVGHSHDAKDAVPLADIRATQKIRTVIMDGKVVDTSLDPNFRNPLPRPVAEYPMDSRNPELEALTPEAAIEGDPSVEIAVTGKKFNHQSIVRFDTADLPTKFVSESKLTATVKGSLLKTPGTYAVIVINPGPTGGVSSELYLIVRYRN